MSNAERVGRKPRRGRIDDEPPKQGEVHFNVVFKFDVNGFDQWAPEQIAAFIKGIGEVIAIQEAAR
jgi:hypothetical protein